MECKEGLGSPITVARELSRYKLHLVGVQEVRLDKGGKVTAGDYFFMEKETKTINWEQVLLYTTEQYQQLRE
jgi:hypothetical protein